MDHYSERAITYTEDLEPGQVLLLAKEIGEDPEKTLLDLVDFCESHNLCWHAAREITHNVTGEVVDFAWNGRL